MASIAPEQVLEPIQRPPGGGRLGREVKLISNSFQLSFDPNPNANPNDPKDPRPAFLAQTWFKYQVTITPLKSKATRPPPKTLNVKIWKALEALRAPELGSVKLVYDGMNACWSGRRLPAGNISIEVTLEHERVPSFNVAISDEIEIDVNSLRAWVNRGTSHQADALDCLSAINTLFHHTVSMIYPSTGRSFYLGNKDLALEKGIKLSGNETYETLALRKGIELWRGFNRHVRGDPAVNGGLLLTVNTTTGAFIRNGDMPNWIRAFIGQSKIEAAYVGSLQARDRIEISRILKGVAITIKLNGEREPLRTKINVGLSDKSARNYMFVNQDAVEISVERHFLETYGIRLKHPDLPCIVTKAGRVYPAELCTIVPGHKSNKRLSSAQQVEATRFQTLGPGDRYRRILQIQSDLSQDPNLQHCLSQFNLSLNAGPRKVMGRVLDAPKIHYGNSGTVFVRDGSWKMAEKKTRFLIGSRLDSFAVIIVGPQSRDHPFAGFLLGYLQQAFDLGIMTPERLNKQDVSGLFQYHQMGDTMEKTVNFALQKAGNFFRRKADIVFCYFPVPSDPLYDAFKTAGALNGVATQAVGKKSLGKNSDYQFIVNLSMKINTKLRGVNFKFDRDTYKFGSPLRLADGETMVFGADVTHEDGKPSVACVVGSVDLDCQVYKDEITAQGLREPTADSKSSRAKKVEIMEHLDEMVLNLLQANHDNLAKQGKCKPPKNLLFVRDGVSDSEWGEVLQDEEAKIRAAVEEMKRRNPRELSQWEPKLTLILSVKRHHQRFFVPEAATARAGVTVPNIPAGCVVDSFVTDPRAFDWYAASHKGILGTTRPTRYVCMVDDNADNNGKRLTPDDVEGIINALCYSYQRCNRAVSVPAPVYYADLICTRARGFVKDLANNDGTASFTGSFSSDGTPESRAQDLRDVQNRLRDVIAGLRRMALGSMWWM